MTLNEFKREGFVVKKEFEVEGKKFYIEKCHNSRYFSTYINGRQITRATAHRIRAEIIEAVMKAMEEAKEEPADESGRCRA